MDTNSSALNWKNLPTEKQESIQKFYADLESLTQFSNNANQKLFIYLYGEQLGKHLWVKFRELDFFLFLKYLDIGNREILLSNIFGHPKKSLGGSHPLYAHC